MKISIERSILLEALTQVSKAIEAKTKIPILTGVYIRAKDDRLSIRGSDSIFSISADVNDFEMLDPGACVIPAKQLLEVVRKLPEDTITIESDGSGTLVQCRKSKVTFPALDPDEYPADEKGESVMYRLDGKQFARIVEDTVFAVLTTDGTPILQGVCFELNGSTLTASGCDRHRLGQHECGFEMDGLLRLTVPTSILTTVAAMKPDSIEIGFAGSSIRIVAKQYTFESKLLEGMYPDISKLLPNAFTTIATCNTRDLLRALDLSKIIAEGKTKIAKIEVAAKSIRVSARDTGAMEETIDADVDGGALIVSANAEYLVDALKCIQTDRTRLKFNGAMSPIIIRGEGDEAATFLVLPYRTTS
ncbi:DNA polymerase III subunit beta [Paenibacillus cymbidii]|uniref:DNA polymerase III subunit beta n=1 Tax=Paenibacillus cymbidii TaxID=1639034 RepID=UPI0014369440|nr:DNA polymerase III subunit beta [Paenibacillus cymbidii]